MRTTAARTAESVRALRETDESSFRRELHALEVSRALSRSADPPFELIGLWRGFVGEHLPGNDVYPGRQVKYLDAVERQAYELHVSDGELRDVDGNRYDTSDGTKPLGSSDPWSIFVMDHRGRFFASKVWRSGQFNHSSLVGGEPVAGAGLIRVDNGKLTHLSNRSGHYYPPHRLTAQTVAHLSGQGVPMGEVEFIIIDD
ncbi:hypothetical protein ACWIGW_10640 [Nocardia brasiliensis]